MPSYYLQPQEYAAYGVPNATTVQVAQASELIDAYLLRPEGLIYAPDGQGNPAYMVKPLPSITLTSTQTILPGSNVSIVVTGGTNAIALGSTQSGFVCTINKENSSITESCIVISVVGQTVILSNVLFEHAEGSLLEFGLCIFESKQMPAGRPQTQLSRFPVNYILAGQGRYGYSRRGNSGAYALNEFNLLAQYTMFGGPPTWEIFNQTLVGVDPDTGNVWAPAGILLAYYTEIRFSYIAGFTYANLPSQIKMACAKIITSLVQMPINGAIKGLRAGDTAVQFFASTNLSEDTIALIYPYQARIYV